jgi:hypothetical protein
MNERHYRLHDNTGRCYGDTLDFDSAALAAAEYTYPWEVTDHESDEGVMVIIDAPHCIQDCREEDE